MLDFDFTPSRTLKSYSWQLQDKDGHTVKKGVMPGEDSNQAVRLAVIGGVEIPGRYSLILLGDAGSSGGVSSGNEVQRFTFTVEFLH